jgi:hypothetical protein
MILLPAIDLMSGEVVRLRQGKAAEKTVYSRDPAAFARRWESEGGDYLHVVDLDAAFSGEQRNLDSVRAICEAVSFPVELGGGMRSEAAIRRAIDSPSPLPSGLVEKKGSCIRSRFSAEMPDPVSVTETRTSGSSMSMAIPARPPRPRWR